MNLAEYRATVAKPKRKFGNVPVVVNGVRFDSKREAARHVALEMMQQAGVIRDLKRQVTFDLVVEGELVGRIRPDFTYTESDGVKVAEDSKGGIQTDVHKLRWKLAKVLHRDWEWRLS